MFIFWRISDPGLNVSDDFSLGGGGEAVAALEEDFHQVIRQVAPGQIQSRDGVRQSIPYNI